MTPTKRGKGTEQGSWEPEWHPDFCTVEGETGVLASVPQTSLGQVPRGSTKPSLYRALHPWQKKILTI